MAKVSVTFELDHVETSPVLFDLTVLAATATGPVAIAHDQVSVDVPTAPLQPTTLAHSTPVVS